MRYILCIVLVVAVVAWPRRAAALDQSYTRRASFIVRLNASADEAFPMFDPIHESKWAPDWKPRLLDSSVHEGLVFLVGSGAQRSTWIVRRYDLARHEIAYIVVSSTTVTQIDIAVANAEHDRSVARVTYTRTALDRRALAGVEHFITHAGAQGPDWETAINGVLEAAQRQ